MKTLQEIAETTAHGYVISRADYSSRNNATNVLAFQDSVLLNARANNVITHKINLPMVSIDADWYLCTKYGELV